MGESPLHRVVVVLCRTEGALNLGSVARLCGNHGTSLRLVAPIAERTSREAMMMGHPARELMETAPIFDSLASAVADVDCVLGTSSKLLAAKEAPVLTVDSARRFLPAEDSNQSLALVFGNERDGLTIEEGALCHHVVRLHTPGPHPSLNLSHAVAAVLTLLVAAAAAPPPPPVLSPRARDRLVSDWLRLLEKTPYFRSSTAAHFRPQLVRLVDRMQLDDHDAGLLVGMGRTLLQALASAPAASDPEPAKDGGEP